MLSTRNSLARAGSTTARTAAREGFFLDASREIRRSFPNLVLIVTGGFRSRGGVRRALEDGACDAVGFGRPAVMFPDLPSKIMFNNELPDEEARFDVEAAPPVPGWIASRIRSVGAGAETVSKRYPLLDYSILTADNGDIRNIMRLSCEASSRVLGICIKCVSDSARNDSSSCNPTYRFSATYRPQRVDGLTS
jgi:hypothetical protein